MGRSQRDYFTEEAVEKDEDRLSYSVSAAVGKVFLSSKLSAGISYGRRFKENSKVEACTAANESGTLESCKLLPLAEAAEIDTAPVFVEYRSWFGSWATSPKFLYDLDREIFAASWPFYLITDSKGGWTGGFRLDWEEGADLQVALFVGAPLSF